MAIAEINGIPIRYEDTGGDGPAIIFSHGFMMDHTMFDAQIARFGDTYRCIRWDERGFGDTPAPEHFSYWDSADDAAAVLDACGVDQAVWVGMSQGGFLSLRGALAHHARVKALVLIDSDAAIDPPEVLDAYRGMLAAATGDDDEAFEAVMQGVAGLILCTEQLAAEWVPKWRARRGSSPLEITGQTLLSRDDISDRLGEISCPALVVHGTDDVAIPIDRGAAVCHALADCRGFVRVDGAGHASNMSHPDIVNDAIAAFLEGL